MKNKSIQWRLSASYAGIALFATLLLGAIMLVTLQEFYVNQEREYLTENAISISQIIEEAQRGNLPSEEIEQLLQSLAFFSNTRIMLLTSEKETLYDTGSPMERSFFSLEPSSEGSYPSEESGFVLGSVLVIDEMLSGETITLDEGMILLEERGGGYPGWMIADPMGEILREDATNVSEVRSKQTVEYPVIGADGSQSLTLQLSEGPAYGREILRSVAMGWGISALIAVILAAVGGWLVSRQFSSPLENLTRVTLKMTTGDLGARSEINRQDEFGQLATSFNQMADSIETKVTTLRRFVADAAHQLGTPLTALRTNLELVEDEHIPAALDQVQRMDELTYSLLALSQLEAIDNQGNLEEVDLAQLLGEFSEPFASRAEQAEIGFRINIFGDAHVVNGSQNQLGILIENLIDNAIKFTPSSGEVQVSLEAEKDGLMFIVEDTGIGIPEEDILELFSRFHRGRNAAGYPGNGLGLAIVKTIANQHGAEIEVKRRTEGMVFKVRFPKI